jgi:hypothetical protein
MRKTEENAMNAKEKSEKPIASDNGYNSHGKWSTIENIREIETERGNPFPDVDYPDETPAIWIAFDKKIALRYLLSASEWDSLKTGHKLTKEESKMMRDICSIHLESTDKIICDDGDGGYLLVRGM